LCERELGIPLLSMLNVEGRICSSSCSGRVHSFVHLSIRLAVGSERGEGNYWAISAPWEYDVVCDGVVRLRRALNILLTACTDSRRRRRRKLCFCSHCISRSAPSAANHFGHPSGDTRECGIISLTSSLFITLRGNRVQHFISDSNFDDDTAAQFVMPALVSNNTFSPLLTKPWLLCSYIN
jgi:hypothetical protein